MDLENLRRSYEEKSLEASDLATDPIRQFKDWFKEAQDTESAEWFEPNAMTLATAGKDGYVSSRIVLLKQVTSEGFVFFTNYDSDKGRQMAENPRASLVFFWPHVERQVRIDGTVSKTDSETSDRYFHARPRGSQCGAVASRQSSVLKDRRELVEAAMKVAEQYDGQEIPCPESWGGYLLSPTRIEFWQGRPSRLHDRFVYLPDEASESGWSAQRLAP